MEILGLKGFIFFQALITGLMVGGVYSLVALGIVIINKASGVFNFAHGFMMMIGGLLFWSLFQDTQIAPAVSFVFSGIVLTMLVTGVRWPITWSSRRRVLAIAVLWAITGYALIQTDNLLIRAIMGTAIGSALMGLLIERITIRPLIGQPLFTTVMMTLAVGEVLLGFTQLTWGSVDRSLSVFATTNALGLPQSFPPVRLTNFMGGTVVIKAELLIGFGLALTAFLVFVAFFRFTSIGLSMRATAENPDLAGAVGLRVRTILAIAWAIAGVMAALAGILSGASSGLTINMWGLALRVFPAVLLGGTESISGALIGGLLIGVAEKMGTAYFGSDVGEQLIPYVVLMIVLIIRPYGLFGEKRIERI